MQNDFSKNWKIRTKLIGENVNKLVKKVAIVADQVVVVSTPVDTGRARSNWLASINSPRKDTIDPYVKGSHLGIGEGENAAAAISQAGSIISQRKDGETIYLSNNLDYIGKLNDGYSAQAPRGFVQKAVQAAVDVVNKEKITE